MQFDVIQECDMLKPNLYPLDFSDSLEGIMDIIGLSLNLVGVIIIFFFGLPPRIQERGESSLLLEGKDEDQIKKGKIYRCISKSGLFLLIAGFICQLVEKISC